MELPKLTLKTAPMQFAEFKPIVYEQQVADTGILRESLNKVEARRREANSLKDQKLEVIKNIRNVLDPSEYANFDKQVGELSNRLNELISFGDTGGAIALANNAGSAMANDPTWQNKAMVKAERDKWIAEAKQAGFDSVTIRRMEEENPYYDDGSGKFKHGDYYKSISVTDFLNLIARTTPTRQDAKGSTISRTGQTFSKDGKVISSPVTSDNTIDPNANLLSQATNSSSSTVSINELREIDMYNLFEVIRKDSSLNRGLRTNFRDMQYLYKKSKQILDNPYATEEERQRASDDLNTALESLEGEDGYIINGDADDNEVFDKWIENSARKYFKNVAYKHTSVTTSDTKSIGYNVKTASDTTGTKTESDFSVTGMQRNGYLGFDPQQSYLSQGAKVIVKESGYATYDPALDNISGTPK